MQRDRAECALTTKYIAGEMFRKHCSDPRLDDPAKALGCVAIFLNTIEVSKWHWIAVKKKRSKLGHKWTNVIESKRSSKCMKYEWSKMFFCFADN